MALNGNSTIYGTQTFTDINYTGYGGSLLTATGIAKICLGDSNTFIKNDKSINDVVIQTDRVHIILNNDLVMNQNKRIYSSVPENCQVFYFSKKKYFKSSNIREASYSIGWNQSK